jgi:hypothetical protein
MMGLLEMLMKEIKFDKEGSVGMIKEMNVFMKRKEMFMVMTSDNAKIMKRRQNKSVDFDNGNNVSESNVSCSYYKTNLFTVYNASNINNNNNNNNDKYSIQSMSTFSTRK